MESVWCAGGEHLNNKGTVKDLHICFGWAVCSSVCSSVFPDQLFLFPRTRFKLSSTDKIRNLFCGDIISDRVNRLFIISVVCFIYQDFFLISIPRSKSGAFKYSKSAFLHVRILYFGIRSPPHLPSPENSVAQSSSLKIAQMASQCCSRGQMGCSTATVPASVHFIVACIVYYLKDPVSASCEVFVVSSVVASRLATAFLTGN